MPIIINPQNKKQIKKAIKYLHTRKQETDPLLQFLLETSKQYIQYYLLQNPQLFTNNNTYTQYKNTHKNTRFQNHIKELYTQKSVGTLTQDKLRQLTMQNANTHIKKIQKDKNIPSTLNKQVISQDLKNTLQNKQNTEYTKTINNTIQKTTKTLQTNNNTSIKDKIRQLREDDKKEIKRQHKRIQKNTENRVLWREMMMRQENKPAYKIWQQTPNPHTRHTMTDGQTVPLEEKFIVINDKTGDTDYMDHPGDWTGSASNTANCLCNIKFTNQEPDNDYNTTRKEAEDKAKKIREEVQKRREKRSRQKQETGKNKPATIQPTTSNDSEDIVKDKTENKQKEEQTITIDDISPEAQQVLNDFHKKYKNAPIEHAYIVDVETGHIYDHATGDNGSVSPDFDGISHDRKVIVIHNHPVTPTHGYDAFSTTDINSFFNINSDSEFPSMPYIIATNQHRTQISRFEGIIDNETHNKILNGLTRIQQEEFTWEKTARNVYDENRENRKKQLQVNHAFGYGKEASNRVNEIMERDERICETNIKSEVNDRMTQRTTQYLNDNGIKTWDIQHQTLEDKMRITMKTLRL